MSNAKLIAAGAGVGLGVAGALCLSSLARRPIQQALRDVADRREERRRAEDEQRERETLAREQAEREQQHVNRRLRRLALVLGVLALILMAGGAALWASVELRAPSGNYAYGFDYSDNLHRGTIQVRVPRGYRETMLLRLASLAGQGQPAPTRSAPHIQQLHGLTHNEAVAIAKLHSRPFFLSHRYYEFPSSVASDPTDDRRYSFRVVIREMHHLPVQHTLGVLTSVGGVALLLMTGVLALVLSSSALQRDEVEQRARRILKDGV